VTGQLIIHTLALGQKRPLVPDWNIEFPPHQEVGGEPLTLRALISGIVRREVAAFKERQQARRFVRILTEQQIEEGLARGRVELGGRELDQKMDEEDAVANALLAFEDGIYLVILDGEEQKDLDREIYMRPDSELTFLRLVMLAGG
jgi:hypothetical protein